MLEILYVIGAIGGVIYLIGYLWSVIRELKDYFLKIKKRDQKTPIGFMTKGERAEMEARFSGKKQG